MFFMRGGCSTQPILENVQITVGLYFGPWYVLKTQHMQEGCIVREWWQSVFHERGVQYSANTGECSNNGGALFGPWYVLKTQHMQEGCISERMVAKCFSSPEQIGGCSTQPILENVQITVGLYLGHGMCKNTTHARSLTEWW